MGCTANAGRRLGSLCYTTATYRLGAVVGCCVGGHTCVPTVLLLRPKNISSFPNGNGPITRLYWKQTVTSCWSAYGLLKTPFPKGFWHCRRTPGRLSNGKQSSTRWERYDF